MGRRHRRHGPRREEQTVAQTTPAAEIDDIATLASQLKDAAPLLDAKDSETLASLASDGN